MRRKLKNRRGWLVHGILQEKTLGHNPISCRQIRSLIETSKSSRPSAVKPLMAQRTQTVCMLLWPKFPRFTVSVSLAVAPSEHVLQLVHICLAVFVPVDFDFVFSEDTIRYHGTIIYHGKRPFCYGRCTCVATCSLDSGGRQQLCRADVCNDAMGEEQRHQFIRRPGTPEQRQEQRHQVYPLGITLGARGELLQCAPSMHRAQDCAVGVTEQEEVAMGALLRRWGCRLPWWQQVQGRRVHRSRRQGWRHASGGVQGDTGHGTVSSAVAGAATDGEAATVAVLVSGSVTWRRQNKLSNTQKPKQRATQQKTSTTSSVVGVAGGAVGVWSKCTCARAAGGQFVHACVDGVVLGGQVQMCTIRGVRSLDMRYASIHDDGAARCSAITFVVVMLLCTAPHHEQTRACRHDHAAASVS